MKTIFLDDAPSGVFLNIKTSQLLSEEIYENGIPFCPSPKLFFIATIISFIVHTFLVYILSEYSMFTNREPNFVSEESKSITVTMAYEVSKLIEPNHHIVMTQKLKTKINNHKIEIKNSIKSDNKNDYRLTHELVNKPIKKEEIKQIILRDILDNVSSYFENESNDSPPTSKKFITMNPKLRQKIFEQSKSNRNRKNIDEFRDYQGNNRYFEYKSTGGTSMVRIKGKCFIIPNDDPFSHEPKVWLNLGSCGNKRKLNFNR